MKKVVWIVLGVLVGYVSFLAFYKDPAKKHLIIAEKYEIQKTSDSILKVEDSNAFNNIERTAPEVPGHDDIVFFDDRNAAFVTAMDGYIWKVDLKTNAAEKFVKAPLVPPGARRHPVQKNKMIFCASKLHGRQHPDSEKVGLYSLNVDTKVIEPVLQRVFSPEPIDSPANGSIGDSNHGIVYSDANAPKMTFDAMAGEKGMDMPFCNDLAISADGNRIYFTAPYSYAGASMSGGTFGEAITLARNGLLWKYDVPSRVLSLVARDFNFIDGILIEENGTTREESVLITETTKFKLDRLFVGGRRAGTHEVVWEHLPGMPDGLDRDSQGRIWIGFVKKRTPILTWAHAHPWIKNLFLNLPSFLLPVPKQTGILALSRDGSTPLYYSMHDGSRVQDIAVVVPHNGRIYLPSFNVHSQGLYSLPMPDSLKN
ncbi:MAG: SMP-30/gluconolaconase/LRE-like region [Spirochaetia bacterium]|nr:SMP-30/gluconolaconase/LRE-like region [Spirochaetia bacterium]